MMTMTNHYLKAALAALMALALAASLLAQFAKPATAALTREALAWGNGPFGELGNGTTSVESPPVEVSNLGAVKAISAGCNHALALQEDGTVWAWGDNSHGQLGNGTSGNGSQGPDTFSNVPVKVSNLDGVKAISAGNTHSLALKEDGTVRAWGYNYYGQLGNATVSNYRKTPVVVKTASGATLGNVRSIAASSRHSLALKEDGTIRAWGDNSLGQLGNAAIVGTSATPVKVKTSSGAILGKVKSIATSGGCYHSLALKTDGTVRAWGHNGYGQLGDATVSNYRKTPVVVKTASGATLGGVRSIATNAYHSLALKEDGTVRAWGGNFDGQLGNAAIVGTSATPVKVKTSSGDALDNIRAIAAGTNFSLAIRQ